MKNKWSLPSAMATAASIIETALQSRYADISIELGAYGAEVAERLRIEVAKPKYQSKAKGSNR